MEEGEQKELKDISIGMGLMDAIPVLLFSGSIALLMMINPSPLFAVGGGICILAGLGKVLWKLLLAVTKKNVHWLSKQLRVLMPFGFLLIVVSLILQRKSISLEVVWALIKIFPGNILFGIACVGFILMGILGSRLDSSKKSSNWIEQSVNTVAQLGLLLGIFNCFAKVTSYQPMESAVFALQGTDKVSVQDINEGYFFDGPGEDIAMIFYPGGMVECQAYSELLIEIAEEGMDVFLVEMPYNFAVYGMNKADKIKAEYSYTHWIVGGHSLGGAMAASYAAKAGKNLDGLVLLAAYAAEDLSAESFKVLSIYGSEDGVLNRQRYMDNKKYLPEGFREVEIPGGNHALFGNYGRQKKDGEADITPMQQWKVAAEAIRDTFL